MADLADVRDALEQIALAAVYPNGGSAPSVTGRDVTVAQGWPPPEDLDIALKAGLSFVSIYALPGTTSKQAVPLSTCDDAVIVAPVHGLTATATDMGFVLSGAPRPNEYVTVIANRKTYAYSTVTGDTSASVVAALAALLGVDLTVVVAGSALSLPTAHSLIVRIGSSGIAGRAIDRQTQSFIISSWAPTPADRSSLGRAIKVAVAQNLTVQMPDTSQSIFLGQTENEFDKDENRLLFRRDLTVQCRWDTLDEYVGFEVTTIMIGINPGTGVRTTSI